MRGGVSRSFRLSPAVHAYTDRKKERAVLHGCPLLCPPGRSRMVRRLGTPAAGHCNPLDCAPPFAVSLAESRQYWYELLHVLQQVAANTCSPSAKA